MVVQFVIILMGLHTPSHSVCNLRTRRTVCILPAQSQPRIMQLQLLHGAHAQLRSKRVGAQVLEPNVSDGHATATPLTVTPQLLHDKIHSKQKQIC
jgi:hypothetical protein